MAVKAQSQITLSSVLDIKATYRYYLLRSSTLAAPKKPTTFPPASPWNDTEPTYTDGSTNSLYVVDCTVFSDDTFSYSEVSLSSSYEAAKSAYNKANSATSFVQQLAGNIYKEGTTLIDGDKLYAGSVGADKIDVAELFAQSINVSGDIHTIASKTWRASDYTQEDCTELDNILGRIASEGYTPTSAEMDMFDFDQDGMLFVDDSRLYWMLELGEDVTVEWKVKIDPNDKDSMIKVWRVYNGPNGMGTVVSYETVVFQVGVSGTSLYTKDLQNFGDIVLESYDTPKIVLNNLTTNETITLPTPEKVERCDWLWSGSLSGTYSATLAGCAPVYRAYIVMGNTIGGSSKTMAIVPASMLSTSAVKFQYADNLNYVSFYVYLSGSNVIVQRAAGSNAAGGLITDIFGLT